MRKGATSRKNGNGKRKVINSGKKSQEEVGTEVAEEEDIGSMEAITRISHTTGIRTMRSSFRRRRGQPWRSS